MEHMVEFHNGTFDGVSEWRIWWGFRMEHRQSFRMEIKTLRVWLSQ